jgi:hypothetical protein
MEFPHQPKTLSRRAQPFSHPEWLFEIKHDGFGALAYVKADQCQLVSRKRYVYKRFEKLTEQIAASLNVQTAVLDGEIVCLDDTGKSQFKSLMYRRGEAYFYAFDILQLNGKDLRSLPLHARKQKLKRLIPEQPSALLYVDYIEQHGERLFHLACREDLRRRRCKIAERRLRLPAFDVVDQDQEPGIHPDCRQRKTVRKEEAVGNLRSGQESKIGLNRSKFLKNLLGDRMKNVYEVLRQKELEVSRLRREVEALRVAAALLSEGEEGGNDNKPKPRLR